MMRPSLSANSSAHYKARMRQLRATMAKQKVAALLVTHLPDVRYLCGFTGSNAALAITKKAALMVTDGRYIAQAAAEAKGAEVRIAKHSHMPSVRRRMAWAVLRLSGFGSSRRRAV